MSPEPDRWNVPCVEPVATAAEIDSARYLLANPDAAERGLLPAEHFAQVPPGHTRWQAVNVEAVRALREGKLARLRLPPPAAPRAPGEAADFLTPALREEFRIPAHPPVSYHVYGAGFAELLSGNPDLLFLDLGAGLRQTVAPNMVNAEIWPSLSTDVVCVGEHLPFADDQFDVAICAAVLEHTRRPWDVARELCRVVRPGGMIRVDWPLIAGVHGYPNHYFNATPEGVVSLFEAACTIQSSTVEANNHPIQGIWWLLSSWANGLPADARAGFERLTIGDILARRPEAQLGDPFCRDLAMATQRDIAAGSTMVAIRKPRPNRAPQEP